MHGTSYWYPMLGLAGPSMGTTGIYGIWYISATRFLSEVPSREPDAHPSSGIWNPTHNIAITIIIIITFKVTRVNYIVAHCVHVDKQDDKAFTVLIEEINTWRLPCSHGGHLHAPTSQLSLSAVWI